MSSAVADVTGDMLNAISRADPLLESVIRMIADGAESAAHLGLAQLQTDDPALAKFAIAAAFQKMQKEMEELDLEQKEFEVVVSRGRMRLESEIDRLDTRADYLEKMVKALVMILEENGISCADTLEEMERAYKAECAEEDAKEMERRGKARGANSNAE